MAIWYRLVPMIMAFVVATTTAFCCETSVLNISDVSSDTFVASSHHGDHCGQTPGKTPDENEVPCNFEWTLDKSVPQSAAIPVPAPSIVTAFVPSFEVPLSRTSVAIAIPAPPELQSQTPLSLSTLLRV